MGKVCEKYSKTNMREKILVDVQAQNKYMTLFTKETRLRKAVNLRRYDSTSSERIGLSPWFTQWNACMLPKIDHSRRFYFYSSSIPDTLIGFIIV
jgi:hypothetical protein